MKIIERDIGWATAPYALDIYEDLLQEKCGANKDSKGDSGWEI